MKPSMKKRRPKVVPHVDVRLSDMTNLTRAKDAVVCSIETEGRRQRGRQSPSEGRLCVKTDAGMHGASSEPAQTPVREGDSR
jgi:hypothetical protein